MRYYTKYYRNEMLDLNEENVKKVFAYCIATKDTPKEKIVNYSFFSDECKVNVPKMHFNEIKLAEMKYTIRYLLGQFANLHTKKDLMYLSDGFNKYDGTVWTTNKMALFSLYYLGVATHNFPSFDHSRMPNKFDTLLPMIPYLKPTLSPNDPNFEKWCIENDKKDKPLSIKWRFKNKDSIAHFFCENEKEFYSLIKERFGLEKDQIVVISIEPDDGRFNY